jgi:hypothetical protein
VKRTFSLAKLRSHTRSEALLTNGLSEPQQPPPETPDPALLYARTRQRAIGYGDELMRALSESLREGDPADLAVIWDLIPFYVDVVATADAAARHTQTATPAVSEAADPAVARYFISSRFLAECQAYLLADPHHFERLHIVTGLALEGHRYTLEQMQKVTMSAQSVVGAKADQQSLTHALIQLMESGHALHSLFHSHPGHGPGATHPSNIDLSTHKRLEEGGYPVIGAIFVPRFVRFFSAERPFTISIYGTGVTPVPGEKNVFQIHTSPRCVSYETITAEE